ncbi:hypothetical protein [Niallia taxi]|uniref:hypothetical protein n=1 Tax=Niallia taxi TaxID=2499688 RepID=UPI0015F5F3D9|nr:hypothetical protein [Niallia taxi]
MRLTKEERLDLVRLIAAKGITRVWLAKEVGKSASLITRYLKSKYDFPPDIQKRIYELVHDYEIPPCGECGCQCDCNKN